jgi:hypothetical protein
LCQWTWLWVVRQEQTNALKKKIATLKKKIFPQKEKLHALSVQLRQLQSLEEHRSRISAQAAELMLVLLERGGSTGLASVRDALVAALRGCVKQARMVQISFDRQHLRASSESSSFSSSSSSSSASSATATTSSSSSHTEPFDSLLRSLTLNRLKLHREATVRDLTSIVEFINKTLVCDITSLLFIVAFHFSDTFCML